jgi:hypothetical protein
MRTTPDTDRPADGARRHARRRTRARRADGTDATAHVNTVERLLSLAAVGALAWWGSSRRDTTAFGAGVLGACSSSAA